MKWNKISDNTFELIVDANIIQVTNVNGSSIIADVIINQEKFTLKKQSTFGTELIILDSNSEQIGQLKYLKWYATKSRLSINEVSFIVDITNRPLATFILLNESTNKELANVSLTTQDGRAIDKTEVYYEKSPNENPELKEQLLATAILFVHMYPILTSEMGFNLMLNNFTI